MSSRPWKIARLAGLIVVLGAILAASLQLLTYLGKPEEDPEVAALSSYIRSTAAQSRQRSAPQAIPDDQTQFLAALQSARSGYASAETELAKAGTRATRAQAICKALSARPGELRHVESWQGKVLKVGASLDGEGMLSVSLADDISLTNWAPAGPDIFLSPGSDAFRAAEHLKAGDPVLFSGDFFPSDPDCVLELSVFVEPSIQTPLFQFRFTDIQNRP